MQTSENKHLPLISVVVPVCSEADNVSPLAARIATALSATGLPYELLFVDDGSTDQTPDRLRQLAAASPAVRILELSRNFGHQAALLAGLEHARGDAVISLDGDLQHPPELIPELIGHWRAGAEIVQAVRRDPVGGNALKRAGSRWFYRLLGAATRLDLTPGSADFRLLSRIAVDALVACRERCRFNRGLVRWIGFRQVQVPYDAAERLTGHSKYSLRSMLRLASDALFSFSILPLRLAGLAGGLISLAAMAYLAFVLGARIFRPDLVVPGWSSILASVLLIGGVQLIVLWILGEYVGRLYEEVKQRPSYIVRTDSAAATTDVVTIARQEVVLSERD